MTSFRIAAVFGMLVVSAAQAQSSTFDLMQGAKNIGRSTFTLAKAKQGYKLSSRNSYHINGAESDFSDDFKFSDDYAYIEGGANSISTQMHTSYTPNKARTELVIGMVQANIQESKHLSIKPDLAVLPNYDAGAAQAMLMLATTHPTEKNLYNVVVPGGSVAGPSSSEGGEPAPAGRPTPGNFAYDALWTKGPDATGTLEGKPVPLHTFILTAGRNTWTFFASADDTLMQLDNSMARASYVRAKFKLDVAQ